MMGLTGIGNVGRFAKRMSYGDTRSGFCVGNKGKKYRYTSKTEKLRRKRYPKIKPRRMPATVSFSQDFVAPLILVLAAAAGIIAAIAAMPVNGSGLVIFVMAAAAIVAVGILAAGKAAKHRRLHLHEER